MQPHDHSNAGDGMELEPVSVSIQDTPYTIKGDGGKLVLEGDGTEHDITGVLTSEVDRGDIEVSDKKLQELFSDNFDNVKTELQRELSFDEVGLEKITTDVDPGKLLVTSSAGIGVVDIEEFEDDDEQEFSSSEDFRANVGKMEAGETYQMDRFVAPVDTTLYITRGGIRAGGRAEAGLVIQVYDYSNHEVLYSTNEMYEMNDPPEEVNVANKDISIRIVNDSGEQQSEVSGNITGEIRE